MKKQQTAHSVGSPYVNKKHLPMMGVGPVYVAVIIAVTVIAVIAGRSAAFEKGRVPSLKIPLLIMGILLIVLGIYLWAGAMFRSKIDNHIAENRLATTGAYALVRNPIYSAFMFFCTGALMIAGNLFFLPLFFFYWIFMTVLMKCTEERWLKDLYGMEYEKYCSRVNRCIPWPLK
ncbi:MAG: isoprenylcysteine carboxylmethyltransferase family protein [Acetatifactor muris]|nr:isoprenylcysteine carboxylmethyltransferase family protein [Acetatifactor muris]